MCLPLPCAAWGEEHDAFKKLAETVGLADTPLVIAGVPISNSEAYPVNPKLAVGVEVAAECPGSLRAVRGHPHGPGQKPATCPAGIKCMCCA
jgi:hypothetical protein